MAVEDLKKKPKSDKPQPMLKFQCGHERPVLSITREPCPACRAATRQAKNRARHAEWEARKASRPSSDEGRLPPESTKNLRWDGSLWHGELLMVIGGNLKVFRFDADTEKKCFHGLDAEYRKFLAEEDKQKEAS